MITLQEILEKENKTRKEDGKFGIKDCKQSIVDYINTNKYYNNLYDTDKFETDLNNLLDYYVKLANHDTYFNQTMVLACYELINENK